MGAQKGRRGSGCSLLEEEALAILKESEGAEGGQLLLDLLHLFLHAAKVGLEAKHVEAAGPQGDHTLAET